VFNRFSRLSLSLSRFSLAYALHLLAGGVMNRIRLIKVKTYSHQLSRINASQNVQVTDIPRTRNGKIVELAVRNVNLHHGSGQRHWLVSPIRKR
jgi:hypothetical protein